MKQKNDGLLETGGFASVFKLTVDNESVAIKKPSNRTGALEFFKNEIAIHRSLRHSNVVDFLDAVDSPPSHSLVMELMDGDLFNFMKDDKRPISSMMRFSIALDIARGLSYLHNEMRILHRDLKPENILFKRHNDTVIMKICDFGFAIPMDSTAFNSCGTLQYVAPELLSSTSIPPYSIKSDIYAFAMIVWMLTSKCDPFVKALGSIKQMAQLISKGECDDIRTNTHIYLSKIIIACRALNPEHRALAMDISNQLSEALMFPSELYHHEMLHLATDTASVHLTQARKMELLSFIIQYPHVLTWELDDKGNNFLHYVFAANHTQVIDELIKLPQWNMLSQTKNIKNNWTLLHSATSASHVELHRYLNAIDINATTNHGSSALMMAVSTGDREGCLLLIRLNADLNLQNRHGLSALIWASKNSKAYICQLLLEHGASPLLKDKNDKTAEDLWSGTSEIPFNENKKNQPYPGHANNLNLLFKTVVVQESGLVAQRKTQCSMLA